MATKKLKTLGYLILGPGCRPLRMRRQGKFRRLVGYDDRGVIEVFPNRDDAKSAIGIDRAYDTFFEHPFTERLIVRLVSDQ